MTELKDQLPIVSADIGGEPMRGVDGRKLHAFLGVKRDFSTWVKAQIERGGFIEGTEYAKFPEKSLSPFRGNIAGDRNGAATSGKPRIDYFFTITAAKEICMLSQTARGKEARLYFIECERIAKAAVRQTAPALPNFLDPAEAAVAWAEQFRKAQALENQIKEDAPKVEFAEDLMNSDSEIVVTDAGYSFNIPQRKFFSYLRAKNWLWSHEYRCTAWAIKMQYMRMKPVPKKNKEGEYRHQPVFTSKGYFAIYKKLVEDKIIERNPQLEMSMA